MNKIRLLATSMVLNLALIVTACALFYRVAQSEQSLRQAELKIEYERCVRRLCIPSEALYHDISKPAHNSIFRQICDLRRGYFPKNFLPYVAIVRPGSASIHESQVPTFIANGSFETFWLNESDCGLAQLASDVENATELGDYIQAQSQKTNAHVVSLTERLLLSPTSHHRIQAARLLLALGYRDAKILEVVKAFAEEEMTPARYRGRTKTIYSQERDKALELNAQYELGILEQPANNPDAGDGK